MLNGSILQDKMSTFPFSFRTNKGDIIDIVELLAVLLCIPLSYTFALYIINNYHFPFYTIDFKLFILYYFNYFNYSWQFNLSEFMFFTVIILISWHVFSRMTIMARVPGNQRFLTVILEFVRGNLFILIILLLVKFLFNLTSIPVIFIFTYIAVSLPVTLAIRLFSIYRFKIYRARGPGLRQITVIADSNYTGIIDKLIGQKEWGFKIFSIISDSPEVKTRYGKEIPVLAEGKDQLKRILETSIIDEVLYCKKEVDKKEIRNLVEICNEIGIVMRIQSSRSDLDPMEIRLKTVNEKGRLALVDMPSFKLPLEIKTMTDFYLSIIALMLLSPLFMLIMLAIKIDSRGPVFFKQERIGLRGRKFKLYKFRTMVEDAEEMLDRLKERNEMDGPVFKIKNDPRITRFGSFLRRSGLDEFPQLINVIKGDMSLIGPRPPLESEVVQYQRWHLRRLSVKPGITCTWQIMPDRNDVGFEKWMQMDLNYIDNWSLGLDLQLTFKTIVTFFTAGGR